MKKLILKTICITFGATVILLVAVFGLMSLWAPKTMMEFTASLGLDAISGDYAYQEYERSEKLDYLSRSFIVAAHTKSDKKALKRFNQLRENEKFEGFCEEQGNIVLTENDSLSYRSYIYAQGVCVMYRTSTKDEWDAILDLAARETAENFPVGNPMAALATEALSAKEPSREFCEKLLIKFSDEEKWNKDQVDYKYIIKFLNDLTEGMQHE